MSLAKIIDWNYGDLLKTLGVEHWQFIIISIVIFLLSSLLYLVYKLGLLQRVKFIKTYLKQSVFLYISYEGPYNNISSTFQEVISDTNMFFKVSNSFAMYFINPKQIQDPNIIQAVVGITVHQAQLSKIKIFLEKHPTYKQRTIPKTQCLATKYPYFNALSFIAIVTRVYSSLNQYVKNNNLTTGMGVLEIYHLLGKEQYIQILAPLQNFDDFNLWYPRTDLKKDN